MDASQYFQDVIDHRHQYAQQWKKASGGKVIGYFCTYVPEEIIYAAGMLPVRILGSSQSSETAEAHIYRSFCPFVRCCMAEGLAGEYGYLDGIVDAYACAHLRQLFDSWRRHVPTSYHYYIDTAGDFQSRHAKEYLATQFREFKDSLEQWSGRTISPSDIDRAIGVYDANRRLLRQLYERRKAAVPPISGAQVMDIVLAAMLSDKREHSTALQQIVDELPTGNTDLAQRPRVMIVGAGHDDREVVQLVESLGAVVVVDEHCVGTRYFWTQTGPHEDGLFAIAERSINRPPCPDVDMVERRRFAHLRRLAGDFGVQGVIILQLVACDTFAFDIPGIRAMLEVDGIRTLVITTDVPNPLGQIRTNVQAFLEMLPDAVGAASGV